MRKLSYLLLATAAAFSSCATEGSLRDRPPYTLLDKWARDSRYHSDNHPVSEAESRPVLPEPESGSSSSFPGFHDWVTGGLEADHSYSFGGWFQFQRMLHLQDLGNGYRGKNEFPFPSRRR